MIHMSIFTCFSIYQHVIRLLYLYIFKFIWATVDFIVEGILSLSHRQSSTSIWKENRFVYVVIDNQNWTKDLNLQHLGFIAQHFIFLWYVTLWRQVQGLHLRAEVFDKMFFKHSIEGEYSVGLVYRGQFLRSTINNSDTLVRKFNLGIA